MAYSLPSAFKLSSPLNYHDVIVGFSSGLGVLLNPSANVRRLKATGFSPGSPPTCC